MFLKVIHIVFDWTAARFWVQVLGGQGLFLCSFHVLPVSGVGFLLGAAE